MNTYYIGSKEALLDLYSTISKFEGFNKSLFPYKYPCILCYSSYDSGYRIYNDCYQTFIYMDDFINKGEGHICLN